jgi:hypothetical protein
MNEANLILVEDWISYHVQPKHKGNDYCISGEKLSLLIECQPLEALLVMYKISELSDDKNVLASLGAGPLEDLLQSKHAGNYIDEVIIRARQYENWRFALGCVWSKSFTNKDIVNKLETALTKFYPNGRP